MNKSFLELKSLLEGQCIKEILPPDADEAICKFVLFNGKSFRLHATDLGFWIEGTANSNGFYSSLIDLVHDYHNHERSYDDEYDWNPPDPIIHINTDTLSFTSAKEKEFKIHISSLTVKEFSLCKSDFNKLNDFCHSGMVVVK